MSNSRMTLYQNSVTFKTQRKGWSDPRVLRALLTPFFFFFFFSETRFLCIALVVLELTL
jgi:hypothetical protein